LLKERLLAEKLVKCGVSTDCLRYWRIARSRLLSATVFFLELTILLWLLVAILDCNILVGFTFAKGGETTFGVELLRR
jgi:hypothetical protein